MVFGKIVNPRVPARTVEVYKEVMNRKGDDRFTDQGTDEEACLDEFLEFELCFQYNESFYEILSRGFGRLIGNVILEDGIIVPPSIEGYGAFIEIGQELIHDSSKTMAFIKVNVKAFNFLNGLIGNDFVQFDLLVHDRRTNGYYKFSDIPKDELDKSMLDNFTVCAFGLKSVSYDTVYPN